MRRQRGCLSQVAAHFDRLGRAGWGRARGVEGRMTAAENPHVSTYDAGMSRSGSRSGADVRTSHEALVPPRLRPGDRVRLVSPSSFPSREHVAYLTGMLTGWGLVVEVAEHVFDEH